MSNTQEKLLEEYVTSLQNKKDITTELLGFIEKNPKFVYEQMQKAEYSEIFKPYTDAIKKALSNAKQQYADAIIYNIEGKILMLLRNAKDGNSELDMKWSLPGGHIDEGETPEQAAIREIIEETNLTVENIAYRLIKENDKCVIHYFSCFVDPDQLAILDAGEHTNLKWVDKKQLQELDCIYDLKEILNMLVFPEFKMEPIIMKEETEVEKTDEISQLDDAFQVIKAAFDAGQISEEKYLQAVKSYNENIEKAKKSEEIKKQKGVKVDVEKFLSNHTQPGNLYELEYNGKKFYVARHGETEDNVAGKLRTPDTKLTDKGRKQIDALKDDIRKRKLNVPLVYTSKLPRAVETAKGLGIKGKLVEVDWLVTWDLGEYEGKIEEDYKKEIENDVKKDPDKKVGKTGESFNEFKNRVITNLKKHLDSSADNTIFVTHSSVVKMIQAWEKADQSDNIDIEKIKKSFTDEFEFYDNKFNFKIQMKSLVDDTYIEVFTTTNLQRKHVIEMFEEIEENGKKKYKIESSKLEEILKSYKIEVPDKHQVGTKVPKGGSSCATCEYVSANHKHCSNEYWIEWNKGETCLPEKAEEYCCDYWDSDEIKKALETLKIAFDNDEITSEQYVKALDESKKAIKLKKGRKAFPIGTISKDKRYIKTAKGWELVPQRGTEGVIDDIKEADKAGAFGKKSQNSHLIDYLEGLAKMNVNEKQKAFFEWEKNNAKQIHLVHVDEIRKKYPKIDAYLKDENPVIKQCYMNASKLTIAVPEVQYIEGMVNMSGLPIEHAWNKIGDEYFDITNDIALKDLDKMPFTEYVSIVELKEDELLKYAMKTGTYGGMIAEKYMADNNIEKSEETQQINIGATRMWHGRKFKMTASGWTHVDEKKSGLKTDKPKEKRKIQDFTDEELDQHAERSSDSDLLQLVKEGRNPKLRDVAARHLANRQQRKKEHSLYDLQILEEVDGDKDNSEDNTIHFDKEISPDVKELLEKHKVKYQVHTAGEQ